MADDAPLILPTLPAMPLRAAIIRAYRAPEPECVAALLPLATLPPAQAAPAAATAMRLIEALRARGTGSAAEALMRAYDLSSHEGVALMCLAEALLRIPDRPTRDALIRDKISQGDWRGRLGASASLFVSAATWGLVVTGKLTATSNETGLGAALTRLIARGGEPLIRAGVDLAMRLMGEQFVAGETITQALSHARRLEARGFRYSYDMLGEAAATAEDAARYVADYETAIRAIGATLAPGGALHARPGISIKLSALHPRYTHTQRERVMAELLPRLRALALLAREHNIGLNIDAEEAERLDLSLDLLEALCRDPAFDHWHGIGFVVQAYQKRAPCVLDWLIDLARRTRHRLMVRLVKGAYWDSEIKRAQVDGLDDFPVFTRKPHTDISFLACARTLLDAPDAVFPQFATHNAATLAAIHAMADDDFNDKQYEFQCLHGMGEALYEEVVGSEKLDRPCRIYAPVGTHATLLAYLVRRLLENGANSSFVHRVRDPAITVADLAADPVALVAARLPIGAPNDRIRLPRDLYAPARRNAAGIDLSNDQEFAFVTEALRQSADRSWHAGDPAGPAQSVKNPADRRDVVGHVVPTSPAALEAALASATAAAPGWQATPPALRAAALLRAADTLEAERRHVLGLLVREAGRTIPNAVAELREAVDFLRYYATEASRLEPATHAALGPVACISPWNFPAAIFTGQIAAALAAGNCVLAKPAPETPLIAARIVAILHGSGIPADALHLLPGDGDLGARLVADPRIRGVVFTGSTATARRIQRALAERLNPDGAPVPLIAETGGQNAMVVDSSALAEQVVADVLVSAFDSAGQRCSALRILCLQEEVADRILAMLRGAMAELAIGRPDRLSTDIGPVISDAARDTIEAHVRAMAAAGHAVHRLPLPPACADGSYLAPTLIELSDVSRLIPAEISSETSGNSSLREAQRRSNPVFDDVAPKTGSPRRREAARDDGSTLTAAGMTREIFGPVLHVLRYRREALDALLADINATGYALTFGIHSRIDETIARVTARARAGNIYVNRSLIGAVVGVQPFGGHGLSGTGPKAGGPLYLRRLLARRPLRTGLSGTPPPQARAWAEHLGTAEAAATIAATPVGARQELPGPVGEANVYTTAPRGTVLCLAPDADERARQITAALATGNRALLPPDAMPAPPPALAGWIAPATEPLPDDLAAILFSGRRDDLLALARKVAARPGPILPILTAQPDGAYPLDMLVLERSISTNTAAAGGNAQLMAIG